MINNLRNPTRVLDTVDVNGVHFISFDGSNWNLFIDLPQEDGGGSSPNPDLADYHELFAELTAGAYGFPIELANGNLQFTDVRGDTDFFILFVGDTIELREGSETGDVRLTVEQDT